MKITIQAETEEEQKNFKEVVYKGVTDYYLETRWVENKVVVKADSRSHGDVLYLISRLYVAMMQLKNYWRKNNGNT